MIRSRFICKEEDYRPVTVSSKYPWWCTGYTGDGFHAVIVAYEKDLESLKKRWPDVDDFSDTEERKEITYTSRFTKPDWIEDD